MLTTPALQSSRSNGQVTGKRPSTRETGQVRRRLLRSFVRRGLLPGDDARAIAQWKHGGGFSVDGSCALRPP